MSRWLTIIGFGEEGLDGLTPAARTLIERAETLVGGERHLAKVPNGAAERLRWASPLKLTVDEILKRRERRVVVLATGDPLWFGIGVTLLRAVPAEETWIVPGVSAFALACARLGWPLAEVECLTLHGRSFAFLNGVVAPGAKLLLLSHDGATPLVPRVDDARLQPQPPHRSSIGSVDERCLAGIAESWTAGETLASTRSQWNVFLAPPPKSGVCGPARRRLPPRRPANEARSAGGSASLRADAVGAWDVSRLQLCCHRVAAQPSHAWRHRGRARGRPLRHDQREHGAGAASGASPGRGASRAGQLSPPDAVFIGGGLTTPGLVERCWQALNPRGRLVANAVTVEGEARLFALRAEIGGELTRIAVSRAEPVGAYTGWRPHMPVTQLAATKR
jgi:precorrin-6Y C5,15-methyltransferase (decarboxylating)